MRKERREKREEEEECEGDSEKKRLKAYRHKHINIRNTYARLRWSGRRSPG